MKKTLKNYLAQKLNADVEAKRISYNKNFISRNYLIVSLGGNIYEDEIERIMPTEVYEYYIDQLDEGILKLQIVLPLRTDWKTWEEGILEFWTPEEGKFDLDTECDPTEKEETSTNIEEMIDNLKVGPCYIPGVGAGYSSDEEDLEKLKQFLRGAVFAAKMMRMM